MLGQICIHSALALILNSATELGTGFYDSGCPILTLFEDLYTDSLVDNLELQFKQRNSTG